MSRKEQILPKGGALRWGICGPGNTANDFVMALSTLEQGSHIIVAVASRSNESKALDMACRGGEKFGSWMISESMANRERGIYRSYAELAADSEVDVVYAGVSHSYRHLVVQAAIDNNKPCLVENPMTVTASMAESLVASARRANVFLMEAIWSCFMPSYEFLRDLLATPGKEQPLIGEPKLLVCHMGYKERPCLPLHMLKDRSQSGGALMDIGIYGLNLARLVFNGDFPIVSASGTLYETGVDEMVSITLRYPGNRMAVITVSTNTARPQSVATVYGTTGSVKLCHPFWCCERLEVMDANGLETVETFPVTKGSFNFCNSAGLAYQANEVRDCLRDKKCESATLPLSASLQFRKITDEARRQLGVLFDEDTGVLKS